MLQLLLALEIVSSLAIARLVTRFFHCGRALRGSERGAWLFTCVVSSPDAIVLVAAQVGTHLLTSHNPLLANSASAEGTACLVVAPLFAALAFGVVHGLRLERRASPRIILPTVLLLGLVLGASRARWAPTPRTAARLYLLASAHMLSCAADCYRSAAPPPPACSAFAREFANALARALVYVAPVYPLLAVLVSAALVFAASSTTHLLGLPLARMRWLCHWGALHAPFWLVHMQTKRLVGTGGGGGGAGAALQFDEESAGGPQLARAELAGLRAARLEPRARSHRL